MDRKHLADGNWNQYLNWRQSSGQLRLEVFFKGDQPPKLSERQCFKLKNAFKFHLSVPKVNLNTLGMEEGVMAGRFCTMKLLSLFLAQLGMRLDRMLERITLHVLCRKATSPHLNSGLPQVIPPGEDKFPLSLIGSHTYHQHALLIQELVVWRQWEEQ